MIIRDRYIDPFTDFGFKWLFGTEENKELLIGFLNDLLELKDKIVDVEYRNLEKLPKKFEEDKLLNRAFDISEFLALDKDRQFAYQQDLKTRLDYKNVMDYAKEMAKEEGLKEGIKQGIEQGIDRGREDGKRERNLEIAKNLLDILDVDTIALKTGLTVDEINTLINN